MLPRFIGRGGTVRGSSTRRISRPHSTTPEVTVSLFKLEGSLHRRSPPVKPSLEEEVDVVPPKVGGCRSAYILFDKRDGC